MKRTNNKQSQKTKVPHFIAIGKINLDFTLNLHEEWIKHFAIEVKEIKEPKDLKIIFEIKELWDKIQVSSSTSSLLNIMIYINKCSKLKSFVELLSLNKLKLKEEEKFLEELIVYVTEHNFLFIDESKADLLDAKITFHLKSGKTNLCSIEIGDKESNNEKEEDLNPKFEKLAFEMEKYDYLFIDYNDIISICSTKPKELINKESEETDLTKNNNNTNNDNNNNSNSNNLTLKLQDNLKVFNDYLNAVKYNNKNLNIIIKYPNVIQSIKVINVEILNTITTSMNIANINIFEKKESLAFLNMVNYMSNDKAQEEYDDKHLEYLFSRFVTQTELKRLNMVCFQMISKSLQ